MSLRVARFMLRVVIGLAVTVAVGWAALAFWFDGPASRALAGTLAAGFVLGSAAPFLRARPMRRALGVFTAVWLAVLA